jgi:hypothetical protein
LDRRASTFAHCVTCRINRRRTRHFNRTQRRWYGQTLSNDEPSAKTDEQAKHEHAEAESTSADTRRLGLGVGSGRSNRC